MGGVCAGRGGKEEEGAGQRKAAGSEAGKGERHPALLRLLALVALQELSFAKLWRLCAASMATRLVQALNGFAWIYLPGDLQQEGRELEARGRPGFPWPRRFS